MRGTKREDGEAGFKGILMRSCTKSSDKGERSEGDEWRTRWVCEKPGEAHSAAQKKTSLYVIFSKSMSGSYRTIPDHGGPPKERWPLCHRAFYGTLSASQASLQPSDSYIFKPRNSFGEGICVIKHQKKKKSPSNKINYHRAKTGVEISKLNM